MLSTSLKCPAADRGSQIRSSPRQHHRPVAYRGRVRLARKPRSAMHSLEYAPPLSQSSKDALTPLPPVDAFACLAGLVDHPVSTLARLLSGVISRWGG
ncbi:hypothetical protein OF83DRAFT_1105760 [Amylostereum chailletii]|nr:hypothetical protein OF83DRAFT_1105760 [Amylostereum chailletii]